MRDRKMSFLHRTARFAAARPVGNGIGSATRAFTAGSVRALKESDRREYMSLPLFQFQFVSNPLPPCYLTHYVLLTQRSPNTLRSSNSLRSFTDNPDAAAHNEKHKQDQLQKQKEGKGHWKPELASDSEEAVTADRSEEHGSIKEMQEKTAKQAEEKHK